MELVNRESLVPMTLSLTPELKKLLEDRVASGMYPSRREVIREALELLKERDDLRKRKLTALRKDVRIGVEQLEQGVYAEYNQRTIKQLAERVKSRGARRLLSRPKRTSQ